MPIENEHFVAEALRIVDDAERAGVRLRILGSLAFRLHCSANLALFERMERALTDIDFAGERRDIKGIQTVLRRFGYLEDEKVSMVSEGSRYCFLHPETRVNVDVFIDELFFCHRIPLKGRLQLDTPTIPTTDLLLEKMQIVEINLKDIKDTIVLLLEHPVGAESNGREAIDGSYIARLISDDWGFYYTFVMNLEKVRTFLPEFSAVTPAQAQVISDRVDQLLAGIERAPKSLRWKLRARIGTKVKWYQEVAGKEGAF
jgi:hypothetical protein